MRCLVVFVCFSCVAVFGSTTGSFANDTVIYSFTGFPDGGEPYGKLITDAQGNLYGTTFWGGLPYGCGGEGCGTVFKLVPPGAGHPAWSESVIYAFPGGVGGAFPSGTLAFDDQGHLYGGTAWGGTGAACPGGSQNGCGTIFELSPPVQGQTGWTRTTLYSFQGTPDAWGFADVMVGKHGEVFGTTIEGGVGCTTVGCGTVFRLLPPATGKIDWTETVIHRFAGGLDGASPAAAVIMDGRGNLYGTTTGQNTVGHNEGALSGGTAFMLSPPTKADDRWTETVLKRFELIPTAPGSGPYAPLVMDGAGNLYGTTDLGGIGCGGYGCGTVFKLSPPAKGETAWRDTTIYQFMNNGQAGAVFPAGGLVGGPGGAFYVTTLRGGVPNFLCDNGYCGAVVKLSPPSKGQTAWTGQTIHQFSGPPDGGNTQVGLTFDGHGNLFGTVTPGGSAWEWGGVFEIRHF
jgi:uncharacterized repeat protein (TIGR03803 family)